MDRTELLALITQLGTALKIKGTPTHVDLCRDYYRAALAGSLTKAQLEHVETLARLCQVPGYELPHGIPGECPVCPRLQGAAFTAGQLADVHMGGCGTCGARWLSVR